MPGRKARGRPGLPRAFYASSPVVMVLGMISGSLLHHWLVTGLSAATFILALKMLAPHLPDGLQKLIGSL